VDVGHEKGHDNTQSGRFAASQQSEGSHALCWQVIGLMVSVYLLDPCWAGRAGADDEEQYSDSLGHQHMS
jgi:hypothetical protein